MDIVEQYKVPWQDKNRARKHAKLCGYRDECGNYTGVGLPEYIAIDHSRLFPSVCSKGTGSLGIESVSKN